MDHPNPTREQAFIGIAELMRMAYAGTDLTPGDQQCLAGGLSAKSPRLMRLTIHHLPVAQSHRYFMFLLNPRCES